MKLRVIATTLLLTGSVLGLAACNTAYDRPSAAAQPGRAQADREAIAHVQSELQQLGYYGGPIDGVWGAESRSSMAQFQQSKGLPASGQPDQTSLNALAVSAANAAAAPAPAPVASAPPPPPSSAVPSIAQVQSELQQLGYYQGRVDGRWGPGTRHAMAEFQRTQGLRATGQGDMRSMNALAAAVQASRSGSSGYAPPPPPYR